MSNFMFYPTKRQYLIPISFFEHFFTWDYQMHTKSEWGTDEIKMADAIVKTT